MGGDMEATRETTLPVIVSATPEARDHVKGRFFSSSDDEVVEAPISTEKLRKSLATLCGAVVAVLDDVKAVGQFQLDEVTLQVEITAEAGFVLVGTSKVSGKGGMALKFKR
jgi:hypothetical protein